MAKEFNVKYRISKYNPLYRDELGRYIVNEWTSIYDIGKTFNGMHFTLEEYLRVENNYTNVYINLLKYFNVEILGVFNIEKNFTIDEIIQKMNIYSINLSTDELDIFLKACNSYLIGIDRLEYIFKLIMREMIWCNLKDNKNNILIEFGYDYYTYITCPVIDKKNIDKAYENGIYIEPLL